MKRDVPRLTLVGIVLVLVAVAACCCLLWMAVFGLLSTAVTPVPSPTAGPALAPDYPPGAAETLSSIASSAPPQRDPYELASRLRTGVDLSTPTPEPAGSRQVGVSERFWISDQERNLHFQITATLRYVTAHAYFYVDDSITYDAAALKSSAEAFDTRIFPTDLRLFGDIWRPGVNGDLHLTILNTRTPGAGGYYSSADEYPKGVNPYSNVRKMIYIDVASYTIGSARYNGVLAHELQHAIHWLADQDEEGWVNEGLSELAMRANGYPVGSSDLAFARTPNTQLNAWSDDPGGNSAHYGASYLFLSYCRQRLGDDLLRQLVAEPSNGIAGFDAVLARRGGGLTFLSLFNDWVVANLVNDPSVGGGLYGYSDMSVKLTVPPVGAALPVVRSGQVHQFAATYLGLTAVAPGATLTFSGTQAVSLLGNAAHSGMWQWWGNRGDSMNSTLTRALDLTQLSKATLRLWMWFDIEKDWDYAYVEVSTDEGRTWTTLAGRHTTDTDPVGHNYGHGFTGKSSGWVQEELSLTPFAGKKVLLRLEYVTDDAVNNPGLAVDDICLVETSQCDDVEADVSVWQAKGFVRVGGSLPQRYQVRLVVLTDGQVRVVEMPLDATNRGRLRLPELGGQGGKVVLVVSGTTPVTTEAAQYQLSIQ